VKLVTEENDFSLPKSYLYPVHRDHYSTQGPLHHQIRKSFFVLHSMLQNEHGKEVEDRHVSLAWTM
jgi:hypothetical protein